MESHISDPDVVLEVDVEAVRKHKPPPAKSLQKRSISRVQNENSRLINNLEQKVDTDVNIDRI